MKVNKPRTFEIYPKRGENLKYFAKRVGNCINGVDGGFDFIDRTKTGYSSKILYDNPQSEYLSDLFSLGLFNNKVKVKTLPNGNVRFVTQVHPKDLILI